MYVSSNSTAEETKKKNPMVGDARLGEDLYRRTLGSGIALS